MNEIIFLIARELSSFSTSFVIVPSTSTLSVVLLQDKKCSGVSVFIHGEMNNQFLRNKIVFLFEAYGSISFIIWEV